MKNKYQTPEDNTIFKIKDDGTVVRIDSSSRAELNSELLEIIEVNSYSKKILAAYKGRKLANKICKKKYCNDNYKEYVEMLMVKNYPKEHTKSELGAKYVRWLWVTIIISVISCFFLIPVALLFWFIVVVPTSKKLKKYINEQ
jgi:hypothetical protein